MPRGTKEQPGEYNIAVAKLISKAYKIKKRTHGLSQGHLAIAAQVSRPMMVRMLAGEKHWDIDQIERVCRLLDLDLVDLISQAEQEVSPVADSSNVRALRKNVDLRTVDLNGFDKAANNHHDEGEPI